MDITFSNLKRTKVLKLPIVPSDLQWERPHNNVTMETMNGEINIIGKKKLITLTIASFFPNKTYQFTKSKVNGTQGVDFFTRYKRLEMPVRMIITDKKGKTLLSILVSIDNFAHGIDKAGDTTYSLNLREFPQSKV